MATTQSKNGKRFDEEFKREVAAPASRPGATDEHVGRDLGVSAWSVARWRRRFGIDKSIGGASTPAAGVTTPPAGGVGVPELERQIKALQREVADLREQRTILKKSGRHLLGSPAMKIGVIKTLAGQHSVRKLCRTLGVARSAYHAAAKKSARPRARDNARLGAKARELFERAVATQRPSKGLLHHSDRGSQYASDAYRELLCRHGVIPSI